MQAGDDRSTINYNVCLLIDAVNESPYREIWKTGFPLLVAQINRFEHLKLVISVRSGYERMVFSKATLWCLFHNNASFQSSSFPAPILD